MSLYHFIHPVKSTTPALMVALWPQAVGPSPNGRPRKVVQPQAGGTGGKPAAEPAPSHPAETRKDEVKSVCRPEPRNQGALVSPDPSESHLHHPGTRARLLERLSTGGGRMQAESASHGGATSALGLRSRRSRPRPSPEPVEAGSRSFVFVSRKDRDYRSALRACSPGNLNAHCPALKQLPPTKPSSSPGQVRDLGKEGQRAPAQRPAVAGFGALTTTARWLPHLHL